MPGGKSLTITGQLGDVMRESALAALSWIRTHAADLRIDPEFFSRSDIHLHVPAGAIPKDGPSAGVTMATALASLLTGRPCRPATAMTGEITLRGKVLPVGGIKEKVLAARRSGIRTILLPADNEKDLQDVPADARKDLTFRFSRTVEDVLEQALAPAATGSATGARQGRRKTAASGSGGARGRRGRAQAALPSGH
jgi:ATP-dependent Lon protease